MTRPEPESTPVGAQRLRLEVAPSFGPGFQVLAHVDGVELTSRCAGLGMDPHSFLLPHGSLAAGREPRTVRFARCKACGTYGCGGTDVTIARDGDLVRWTFSGHAPADPACFAADAYDAEVARLVADSSWESTPLRAVQRLVLTGVDHAFLASYGLRMRYVGGDRPDPEAVECTLELGDEQYQVFHRTPWRGQSPEQVAREVCAALAQPPQRWRAGWHPIAYDLVGRPPAMAGPGWVCEDLRDR